MLVQEPCSPETVCNAFDVFHTSKGLPGDVIGECVVWVDFFELLPNASCILNLVQMTKGRSEKSAGKVRPGDEQNPLFQQSGRCFVLSRKEICHAKKVE